MQGQVDTEGEIWGWNKNYKIVTMIISCAYVLESPRRCASNTLPYDFIIEVFVIKEKPHYYDLVFCDNFMSTELFM